MTHSGLPVSELQFGFSTSRGSVDTLPFGVWQDRRFNRGAGEFCANFLQCLVQDVYQPLFQNPDTSKAYLKIYHLRCDWFGA